jgi:hypothetical protein
MVCAWWHECGPPLRLNDGGRRRIGRKQGLRRGVPIYKAAMELRVILRRCLNSGAVEFDADACGSFAAAHMQEATFSETQTII